jgi:hypothetical protein
MFMKIENKKRVVVTMTVSQLNTILAAMDSAAMAGEETGGDAYDDVRPAMEALVKAKHKAEEKYGGEL